ncbi:MAG: response regulator [Nitrospinae bacterium]|nr:response regulator [Nitrospinota bacterium]
MRDVKFLVVDDSPTLRILVRKVLEAKLGVKQIFEAGDGVEARKVLEGQSIDIILSDWEMPNVSGDEFLFQVRNSPRWKEIPFIMMTSHGGRDFIMTAIQNGVTHYLVKPFTAAELEDRVRKSWNGAAKRQADRFSALPTHQMMVKVGGKAFSAQVINISRLGALVKMEYTDSIKLFGEYQLSLEFDSGPGKQPWAINPLFGTAVRMEADSASMAITDKMCQVALNFGANTIDRKVEEKLNELIRWLASFEPESITDK